MINWKDITDGYNRQTASNLTTAEMLEHLYRHKGSTRDVADYLGTSVEALRRRMDLLNVPRIRKSPWPGSQSFKFQGIPEKQFVNSTSDDLAKLLGCSKELIYNLACKTGRQNYLKKGAKNEKVANKTAQTKKKT